MIRDRLPGRRGARALAVAFVSVVSGCSDGLPSETDSGPDGQDGIACSIPESEIVDGGPGKDGIPALTNPRMTEAGTPAADYLDPDHRVIGIVVDGQPVAIPHAVGWWHEIVNLDLGDEKIAITYCPLTGSSLVFDRGAVGGAEFGVSGLLYRSNLIMYDRRTGESFWPQMARRARCGPSDGTPLDMVPSVEMTWAGWTELHPDTWVPAHDQTRGQNFAAYRYPYGDYERIDNPSLLFPVPELDPRRPPKERVLGVPAGQGGIAFPFGVLDEQGPTAVAHASSGGSPIAVFWDRERQSAVAYDRRVGGQTLTFSVANGAIHDDQTGSRWRVDGLAVDGPLNGERLDAIAEAYVAFWFAWAAFHPSIQIWSQEPAAAAEGDWRSEG